MVFLCRCYMFLSCCCVGCFLVLQAGTLQAHGQHQQSHHSNWSLLKNSIEKCPKPCMPVNKNLTILFSNLHFRTTTIWVFCRPLLCYSSIRSGLANKVDLCYTDIIPCVLPSVPNPLPVPCHQNTVTSMPSASDENPPCANTYLLASCTKSAEKLLPLCLADVGLCPSDMHQTAGACTSVLQPRFSYL